MNLLTATALERQMAEHLIIEDKNARLIRFPPNRVQRIYHRQRTLRDITLKARQFGFTTDTLGEFTLNSARIDNLRTVIMAHDKLSTQLMLRKVNRFLERFVIDDYIRPLETEKENANEIIIKETRSTIYIGTAGSKKFGRGDTVQQLLLSEVAKYDDFNEVSTGVMQAVPRNGRIVMETTANGYNFFRKLYYDAKNGLSNYRAHFFPWFWHDEYKIPGAPIERTEKEKELVRMFPEITDDQLRWRRWKMADPAFVQNPLLFDQEYPATDHEAFISSGNTVFNTLAVDALLKTAKPPIFKGNVDELGQISDDSRGFLWIWKFPQRGQTYVAFGDPAEGLGKGDFSAGVIMEYDTAAIVAVWHGHIDPDQFGRHLVGAARYYNQALLGIEDNNHGIATIISARNTGYENLYKRMVYDEATEQETPKLGWHTDTKTKPLMINEFKAVIRDRQINIPDERILLQCMAFEEKEPATEGAEYRKLGAPTGEHDDLVIAASGAYQMRKYTSPLYDDNVPTNYFEDARRNLQT